jgi:ribosomal-protein-alanine N-acetyltransferase
MQPGWSRTQLSEALAEPIARVRLAEREGGVEPGSGVSSEAEDRLAGFVMARRIGDVLEIDLVGVRVEHRQRGIARRLLGELIEREEAEARLAVVQLELAATNAPALALYQGLGFVVVGRRSRYYPDGEDALLLSRTHFVSNRP